MRTSTSRASKLTAGFFAVALTAAACGGSDSTDTDDAAAGGGGGGGTVDLGFLPSWTDGLSTAYLWEHVLEEQGYDVEMTELSDAGLLYAGLSNGDYDVYTSAWPEVTHADYMEKYSDDIEDVGSWYEGAVLTMAVSDYTEEIQSIADLQGKADMFDGRIVGIEPGAGLTRVTKEDAIPTYGLDGEYELVESSTVAMLAELQSATDAQEPIVVTLWRPFWANNEFPVRDLEDPEGAMGDPEALHELSRTGFSDDFPEVAEMMSKLKLTDDQYGSLEKMVTDAGDGEYADAVDQWFEENPDVMESLQS